MLVYPIQNSTNSTFNLDSSKELNRNQTVDQLISQVSKAAEITDTNLNVCSLIKHLKHLECWDKFATVVCATVDSKNREPGSIHTSCINNAMYLLFLFFSKKAAMTEQKLLMT